MINLTNLLLAWEIRTSVKLAAVGWAPLRALKLYCWLSFKQFMCLLAVLVFMVFHKFTKIYYFLNTFRASCLVHWPTFFSFGTSSATSASHEIIFLAVTWGHPSFFRKECCAQVDLTISLNRSRMCSFLMTLGPSVSCFG